MSKKTIKRGAPLAVIHLQQTSPICGVFPDNGNKLNWGQGGNKPYEVSGEWPVEIYSIEDSESILVMRKGKPSEIIYPSIICKILLLDEEKALAKVNMIQTEKKKSNIAADPTKETVIKKDLLREKKMEILKSKFKTSTKKKAK